MMMMMMVMELMTHAEDENGDEDKEAKEPRKDSCRAWWRASLARKKWYRKRLLKPQIRRNDLLIRICSLKIVRIKSHFKKLFTTYAEIYENKIDRFWNYEEWNLQINWVKWFEKHEKIISNWSRFGRWCTQNTQAAAMGLSTRPKKIAMFFCFDNSFWKKRWKIILFYSKLEIWMKKLNFEFFFQFFRFRAHIFLSYLVIWVFFVKVLNFPFFEKIEKLRKKSFGVQIGKI